MDISKYRSDIGELIKEVSSLRGADPEKTIEKCNDLLKYGEERRDDALIGFACFTKGETYYLMNDMTSFYMEMLKCMKPFTRIREWGYMAAVYNMLGIMALNRGNVPMAMDYYYKAFEYCVEHKLPDIKCMVHMNIAGLYLNTRQYEEAHDYFDEAYKYISNHMGMDGYLEKLAAVILGRGKAFLGQENLDGAGAMLAEMEQKCSSFLIDAEKFAVDCFRARLLNAQGDEAGCSQVISDVVNGFNPAIPIMDLFDDIYDFMSMLLDKKLYSEFEKMYEGAMGPIRITSVKNLEKKLMELKLRLLKEKGLMDEYHSLAENYIDMLQAMDAENNMMLSSMITLRSNYYKLNEENKEEKKHSRLLKRKSETDPLTGMSNRLKLNESAEIIYERAITNGVGFAIELLDIDYFKEYNDNYGHQSGDECLLFIAKSIMNLSKSYPGVFCFRYGGDEFVVIYEGFTEKEVFGMAKELKTMIMDAGRVHEFARGNDKVVTISQGICWGVPEDGGSVWDYLHEADTLLYKVKKKSRNSVMLGKSKAHEGEEGSEVRTGHAGRPLITEVMEEEYLPAED